MSVTKRQKLQTESQTPSTRLYSSFRTIGNVTNHVPFSIGTLGKTFYIVTSVGKSFQIYDASNLNLLFISQKQTIGEILCLYAHFQYVYVGHDNYISIYKRGQLESILKCEVENVLDEQIKVTKVIQFGDYLVGISSNNYLFIFKKHSNSKIPNKFYGSIKINENYGQLINLIHPPTYLNKIIITTQSAILIYNIKSLKMIFKSKFEFNNNTFGSISTIEIPPILDLIAIGTNNNEILIYNFKFDKIIKKLKFNSKSSNITSLSFRSDGLNHLVIGYKNGDLIFYDFDNNARIHQLNSIHKSGISNVKYLNGQSIFITNGADNQLREFVFDPSLSINNVDEKKTIIPPPRHLRSRGGHSEPPILIEFVDNKDHYLISSSKDQSFWNFSLRKDSQSQEFSQKSNKINNKIQSEMICLDYNELKQNDWENIITGYKNEKFARLWSFNNKKISKKILSTNDDGFIKSVCISQCGNFGLIGSSNGQISIYNLQSGNLKKQFKFHKKSVTGILIDSMNEIIVSVGLDGLVGFYNLNKSSFLGKINLESPITLMKYQKNLNLIAVALDDLTIIIIDIVTKRIIRQLVGHTNRITSLDFSPNGRWVVSSSLDNSLRTWDLPTGSCIDGIFVNNTITNVKFSPTGNFLATTHVIGNGISLWNNKSQFKSINIRHINENEFIKVDNDYLPNVSGENGANLLEGVNDNDELINNEEMIFKESKQIQNLLTLSNQPRNKFNTIIHLETIKKRNKPIAPPKKPELAPFFLQSGLDNKEENEVKINVDKLDGINKDLDENEKDEEENELKLLNLDELTKDDANILTKITNDKAINFENKFTKLLKNSINSNNDKKIFIDYLLNLSPSNLNLEIQSLNLLNDNNNNKEIKFFLKNIIFGLETNLDFDLLQAIMNIFLRIHGELISNNLNKDEELSEIFKDWKNLETIKNNRMDDLIKNVSGIIGFIKSV